MKWFGKLRDGEKGGNIARVVNGALQVRVVGGSSGSGEDAVARAAIDAYMNLAAGGSPAGVEVLIGENPAGAPLYRKTISISNGPASGPITYAHGITGLLTVERMWGRLTRISTNSHIPLPYVHLTIPIQMSVQDGNVALDSAGAFGAFSGYVYIEYTRS